MDKNQIARLREIPLAAVMTALEATPDPKDPHRNWKTTVGRITVTDQQFFNHDLGEGGGGAIDLTTHVGGYRFREAVAFLADKFGSEAAIEQYQAEAAKHAKRIIEKTPTPKQEIPAYDASKLSRVREYLINKRGITEDLVNKTIVKGRLWADEHGNAVFALYDPNLSGKIIGAELRGTYDKPFHGVRGEKKGMFFTGTTKSKKAVFVESAIDALSYEVLHPKSALVVSTTGSAIDNMLIAAKGLQAKGYKLVAGFDVDKDGERFANTLKALGGVEREKPGQGKDWNEELHILKIEHENKQISAISAAPIKNKIVKEQIEPIR